MDQMQNIEGMPTDNKNGPVVGIIIVIIVLAIGGYYLFAQLQSQQDMRDAAEVQQPQDGATTSTEVPDIQADVDAQQQELDALDTQTNQDLQELDAELKTL